jgi:hypothetical protein
VLEGVVILDSEEQPQEEQGAVVGQEVQSPEAGAEEVVVECPNHEPSVFVRGKPRSISKSPTFEITY